MASGADQYEAYYAGKLWALMPAIYQAEDSSVIGQNGPLREIVNRIGAQAAILRRSIDRTWEDQSIESCDDWVIPYIADLLATRLVSASDPRGRRIDVARTIYYRQRKGTLGVLEEISHDITGWDAKCVEFFRRMGRTPHRLDPEIGWPASAPSFSQAQALQDAEQIVGRFTRMPTHGTADLRSPHTGRLCRTAFDELSYTADMRIGKDHTGWYNIPRLGVFVWRLYSMRVDGVTPVPFTGCPDKLTCDPSGRIIPLFAASTRTYGDAWVTPTEQQVPGRVSRLLWLASPDDLYADIDVYTGAMVPKSFALYTIDNLGTSTESLSLTSLSDVSADPANPSSQTYYIDPEQGVVYVLEGSPPATLATGYQFGFSSAIGAGPYDRRVPGQPQPPVGTRVWGGGSTAPSTAITAALAAAGGNPVVVTIADSLTYTGVANVTVEDTTHATPITLTLNAGNELRPLIRIPMPSAPTPVVWTFTGVAGTSGAPSSSLVLDGLWIAGGEIRLTGTFDTVTINMCTLDPGNAGATADSYATAADGRILGACRLLVDATVKNLVINRSITGPILVEPGSGGLVETMTITDSIVQGLLYDAIDSGSLGVVMMQRSTILGGASFHRLEASNSIFHDLFTVTDRQHSCLRFCAFASIPNSPSSVVPRHYESHHLEPVQSIFTSVSFGDPGYAQLADFAPTILHIAAEGGSEVGAFSREKNAIKEESLLLKLLEYMPVGLSPVIIHVT
jgi:hypothetical protein